MRPTRPTLALIILILAASTRPVAAEEPAAALAPPGGSEALAAFNRVAKLEDGIVYLDAREGDGGAWVIGQEMAEGTLSVELKGTDNQGRSFVGLAFHARDAAAYDVVYLRPFNFNAADAERRARALQYASHPDFPWQVLRARSPGIYEAEVSPAPPADSWVRLVLRIADRRLSVFVNGADEPALEAELLGERRGVRIALWVGNNSEGWFRNLRVVGKGN